LTSSVLRDGNGRLARLLTDLLLARAGYPPAAIRAARASSYNSLLAGYMAAREPEPLQPPGPGDVGPFAHFIAEAVLGEVEERRQE
jgi:hypothetical protein